MAQHITFNWVHTDQQLQQICQQARQQPVITLDTEFVRIRSYYPKLGLIQLFDGVQVCLIDPLDIHDFSPFIALLQDTKVLKVLHACGEDLDIFQHYFQQLPTPMIDTQMMSAFLGQGTSVGFSKLVANYCQVELDKSASRTDWLKRPLSEQQCQYAAADVWYLLPVYQQLQQQLCQTPWLPAVQEECETQKRKRQIVLNPEKAYQKIGNAWQLSRAELAILQVLEKWRLDEAQKRDFALNFIVKEQSLWQIAKTQPKHTACLLEFMHPNEVRRYGKKLLWLVEQGKSVPTDQQPAPIKRLIDEPHYKRDLTFLRNVVTQIKPDNLPLDVFSSKRQLEQLFRWQTQGQPADKMPELLSGWRKPFGEKLWQRYRDFVQNAA